MKRRQAPSILMGPAMLDVLHPEGEGRPTSQVGLSDFTARSRYAVPPK
jgi:hypothetical protein